jgi:hypothetical protein
VSELEVSLRVRLRISDGLHAALQLNQDYIDPGSRLPGGPIAHSSLQRPSRNNKRRTAEQNRESP